MRLALYFRVMNAEIQTQQATLRYPYEQQPQPGTTIEVAPGVRWLAMPMPGSLGFINLYLLQDEHGWWVVDTGLGNNETRDHWHTIFANEMQDMPVVGVICTHMHPDHIGQALMLTDHFQCPLYMTRAEYYQARAFANNSGDSHSSWLGRKFYNRAGMPDDYLNQLASMWSKRPAESMSMPTMVSGYERLRDGQTLTIGQREWRIVVGSGHSPEHACLYCEDLDVLISGDQILPVITSNVSVHSSEPEANPMAEWIDSHQRFLSLIPEDTFVLPAHNLPFYGAHQRLHELIDHHEERMQAILDFCEQPQLAKDMLPVLFNRKLDSRQTMMALGEAIAHAHLLMQRGHLDRYVADNGMHHYRTVFNPQAATL